uniref:Uncharacterized protein n=1 Tax=Trichogramma kaykai TaxID=54128 RepID=A0ABD2WI99_9HYME
MCRRAATVHDTRVARPPPLNVVLSKPHAAFDFFGSGSKEEEKKQEPKDEKADNEKNQIVPWMPKYDINKLVQKLDLDWLITNKTRVSGGLRPHGWETEISRKGLDPETGGIDFNAKLTKPIYGKWNTDVAVEGLIPIGNDSKIHGTFVRKDGKSAWAVDYFKKFFDKSYGSLDVNVGVKKPFEGPIKSMYGIDGSLAIDKDTALSGSIRKEGDKTGWHFEAGHTLVDNDHANVELMAGVNKSPSGKVKKVIGATASLGKPSDVGHIKGEILTENEKNSWYLAFLHRMLDSEYGKLSVNGSLDKTMEGDLKKQIGGEASLILPKTQLHGGINKEDDKTSWYVEGGHRLVGDDTASLNVVAGLSKRTGDALKAAMGLNTTYKMKKIGPMKTIDENNDNVKFENAKKLVNTKYGNIELGGKISEEDGEVQGVAGIEGNLELRR